MGKTLDAFLASHKKDQATISKTLNKELLEVEEEILSRQKNIADAENTIRSNAINVKAISDATGISRKTFYNNRLLAEFVEENKTVDDVPREEIKRLKDKCEDSEKKLLLMVDRDIETETLRHELSKLQSELAAAQKRIQSLEEQHEDDLHKMNKPVVRKSRFQA